MQLNGVSPVWISMCVLRLLALVKEFSQQRMQVKNFPPVCVCMCVRLSVGHSVRLHVGHSVYALLNASFASL